MSRAQRATFLAIAAVFALIAVLIIATRDTDDTSPPRATTAVTTAAPATTAPATTTSETTTGSATAPEEEPQAPTQPAPEVLERGEDGRIEVSKGDRVRFVVRSDIADEVHLHGYDIAKEIRAGGEVTFSFEADITGIFEIELENAGEPLGKLVVNP